MQYQIFRWPSIQPWMPSPVHISFTTNNFTLVSVFLDELFGSKTKTLAAHFKALYAGNAHSGFVSLQLFYDLLKEHNRNLDALQQKPESYGGTLMQCIEEAHQND